LRGQNHRESSIATNDIQDVQTLAELFAWRVAKSPGAEAYREFDAAGQRWQSTSWAEAGARAGTWRAALGALQFPRASKIAVLLPNGLDAVSIDQAALAHACVIVPLHVIDNPDSIAYILGDCEAAMLIVAGYEQWSKVAATGVTLPALKLVVVAANDAPAESSAAIPVSNLTAWLAAGTNTATEQKPAPEDLATIVYTSGTTGKPKGVMLTHANVVANVKATLARVPASVDDVFLSFLPLSHTFERTAGYYLPVAVGACVAYARSVQQLADDLKIVRPTVLISVPRIYERFYARITEILAKSALQSTLFALAQNIGWRRFCKTQGLHAEPASLPFVDALLWPLLQKRVAQTVLARFGGRVRVAVSGGAPLSPEIAHCFLGLGLPLLQGYGMTETSPVVAANGVDDNDPATVGRPLPGFEVRIGELSELQVRGPSVMKGYWKRPEDTAKIMLEGGWLKTGDMAVIENGRIRIMGRIKEIIVTSTGEKVPPGDVELAITTDNLFEQAFVVGENRPFIAAVVVLARSEWNALAAHLRVSADDPASLNSAPVRQALLARIAQHTKTFPRYAQPRAVFATLEPWTIENSLMTPTLKLKRNNLMARYAGEIEGLYKSLPKS
jgi:long-chain acyl-CoA synthetase